MAAVHIRYPGRALVLGDHCDWAGGCGLTVPIPLGIEAHRRAQYDLNLRTQRA